MQATADYPEIDSKHALKKEGHQSQIRSQIQS